MKRVFRVKCIAGHKDSNGCEHFFETGKTYNVYKHESHADNFFGLIPDSRDGYKWYIYLDSLIVNPLNCIFKKNKSRKERLKNKRLRGV